MSALRGIADIVSNASACQTGARRRSKMRTRTLQQMVTFKASPHQVYDILMNSKKHQSLSGEPAKISRKVGGKFTAWGSHISGINLVLKPGKKSCKHGVPQDGGRITT